MKKEGGGMGKRIKEGGFFGVVFLGFCFGLIGSLDLNIRIWILFISILKYF